METGFPPTPFTPPEQAWKLWRNLASLTMTRLAPYLWQIRCCRCCQWSRKVLNKEKVQVAHRQRRLQWSSNLHLRVTWFDKSHSAVAIVDGRYPSKTLEWEHSWSQVERRNIRLDKIKANQKELDMGFCIVDGKCGRLYCIVGRQEGTTELGCVWLREPSERTKWRRRSSWQITVEEKDTEDL